MNEVLGWKFCQVLDFVTNHTCIVSAYALNLGRTVLQETFLMGLGDLCQQFEQKSAKMNLRHQNLWDRLFLSLVLSCLSGSQFCISDWNINLRILFATDVLLIAVNLKTRTVLMRKTWFKLNTMVDRFISEGVEFVLRMFFWRFAVLVWTVNEKTILSAWFICFRGKSWHVMSNIDWF